LFLQLKVPDDLHDQDLYRKKTFFGLQIYDSETPDVFNRSPGSKLLSITTQLHCGCHLGGRAQLPDTILEEDHPMTIPSNLVLIELLVPDKIEYMLNYVVYA
jgi:hypothetical protein